MIKLFSLPPKSKLLNTLRLLHVLHIFSFPVNKHHQLLNCETCIIYAMVLFERTHTYSVFHFFFFFNKTLYCYCWNTCNLEIFTLIAAWFGRLVTNCISLYYAHARPLQSFFSIVVLYARLHRFNPFDIIISNGILIIVECFNEHFTILLLTFGYVQTNLFFFPRGKRRFKRLSHRFIRARRQGWHLRRNICKKNQFVNVCGLFNRFWLFFIV